MRFSRIRSRESRNPASETVIDRKKMPENKDLVWPPLTLTISEIRQLSRLTSRHRRRNDFVCMGCRARAGAVPEAITPSGTAPRLPSGTKVSPFRTSAPTIPFSRGHAQSSGRALGGNVRALPGRPSRAGSARRRDHPWNPKIFRGSSTCGLPRETTGVLFVSPAAARWSQELSPLRKYERAQTQR
jgi:hypothetical protein